jgi:hypothetical protein
VSGRSLAAKLLVKAGDLVWVSDPGRVAVLGPLPDNTRVAAGGGVDRAARVAVVFVDDGAAARAAFDAEAAALKAVPVVWVLYPKANRSDVNRDSLWRLIAPYGLRPITNVAVDDTWSALRFRPLRPDEPQFTGGA